MAEDERKKGLTLSHTDPKWPYKRIVEPIETFSKLSQRLQELKNNRTDQCFNGVHLENPLGDCIAIGLADEGWLLIFDDHTHTNMRYSLGNERAEGNVDYVFEQWECLPNRYLIPVEVALVALRTWLETGAISDAVMWEDNPY